MVWILPINIEDTITSFYKTWEQTKLGGVLFWHSNGEQASKINKT